MSHAAGDGTETDPRFPSGPWVGFFVQDVLRPGRHWMELRLTFSSGVVAGEGRDRVGKFVLLGSYDVADGRCGWVKTYVGKHDVLYAGFNEGKGIWGKWEIPPGPSGIHLHGGFHVWPEGMADPTGETLQAEADLPLEDEVEARPVAAPVGRG